MQLDSKLKEFTKKILIILAFTGGIYLLVQLRYVILLLFLLIVIAYTLLPIVTYFEKYKIPRSLTTGVVLAITLAILGGISYLLFVAIRSEYQALAQLLTSSYNELFVQFQIDQILSGGRISTQELISQLSSTITGSLQSGLQGVAGVGATIFNILFSTLTAVTILFYLVYDPDSITNVLVGILPKKYQSKAIDLNHEIQDKLSKWVQGQFLLMITMAIFSYIGFSVIGVQYALLLAILVGLLDIVPVVGPMIALIPAVLVTMFDDPVKTIWVLVVFFLLQIVEGNVLVPRIMSKTVGLNSLYVIVALLVGSTLAGTLGALLAIPGSVIVKIIYDEYMESTSKA